jgi:hypothetical protein
VTGSDVHGQGEGIDQVWWKTSYSRSGCLDGKNLDRLNSVHLFPVADEPGEGIVEVGQGPAALAAQDAVSRPGGGPSQVAGGACLEGRGIYPRQFRRPTGKLVPCGGAVVGQVPYPGFAVDEKVEGALD